MSKSFNPRITAARILDDVIFNAQPLSSPLNQLKPSQDASFCKALCFGVCRYYFQLDAIIRQLMAKPIKAKEGIVHCLLCIGLYQIIHLRVPDHAAVSETVNAIKQLKKTWAIKLVNGVLRNFLRQQPAILEKVSHNLSVKYNHPQWLIKTLQQAWPEHWQNILAENMQPAPMAIRVNHQKIHREDYLKTLATHHLSAQPHPLNECGLLLDTPCNVDALPGFNEGLCSVQDAAAQLAADYLDLQSGHRVLDACAAPGGKTAHILEKQLSSLQVAAIDMDSKRVEKITDNLRRLDLTATVITADANQTNHWWDGELFDRILLDAPCSATGIIRRHPDIKMVRQQQDIAALCQQQKNLLENLWHCLKPGGILLYATCSILPAENEANMTWFIEQHDDAQVKPLKYAIDPITAIKSPQTYGQQILPGQLNMDGFYYCALQKVTR